MKIHLIYGAAGGLILILFHFVRYLIDPMWVLGEHAALFNAIGFGISMTYTLAISWILRSRSQRNRTTYWQAFKMLFTVIAVMTILHISYDSLFTSWKGKELKPMHEQEIKALMSEGAIHKTMIGIRPIPPSQKDMDADYSPISIHNQEVEKYFQEYMEPVSIPQFIINMFFSLLPTILLSLLLALFVRSRKPREAMEPVPEDQ